ncbi:MAG: acyltransferase domain-containing protein, partial [Chloroflexota bacterium]
MEAEQTGLELHTVLAGLQSAEGADALQTEWAASQATLPAGRLAFLEATFVRSACREAGLPAEVTDLTVATADLVAASKALSALAWHGHYCVYQAPVVPRAAIAAWPSLAALGARLDLFYLLVLLSGMPELRRLYQEHGISSAVARDTLLDIDRWLRVHRDRHGRWGLAPDRLNWLRNHMRGELYQLGRLQFQFGVFASGFQVFRQRSTKRVL